MLRAKNNKKTENSVRNLRVKAFICMLGTKKILLKCGNKENASHKMRCATCMRRLPLERIMETEASLRAFAMQIFAFYVPFADAKDGRCGFDSR